MAIFMCVGYFYFHILEGICFAGFLHFFLQVVTHFTSFHLCFFRQFSDSCECAQQEKASRQTHSQESEKIKKKKQKS
jgi:hypothetical protein